MIWFKIVHVDIYSCFFMVNYHNHANTADSKYGDTKDFNINHDSNIYHNILTI